MRLRIQAFVLYITHFVTLGPTAQGSRLMDKTCCLSKTNEIPIDCYIEARRDVAYYRFASGTLMYILSIFLTCFIVVYMQHLLIHMLQTAFSKARPPQAASHLYRIAHIPQI